MTGVRIPISADASSVANAFEQIRTAIRRAGQEGKAFADLDLSHPELKGVADDLKRMQENYENLKRMGRGSTAAAVRGIGAQDWGAWYDQHAKAFPDEAERRRHAAQAGRYILNGTAFTPPPPAHPGGGGAPAPGGGGPGGGGSPGGGGNNAASFTSLLNAVPGAKIALQLAGLQGLANMAGKAHSLAEDELVANDRLARTLRDTSVSFTGLQDMVRKTADSVGYSYQEVQRYSAEWVKLTNELSAEKTTDAVKFAAGMAKGYGVDPSMLVGGMGRAQFLGEDPKRFAALLSETMMAGGLNGQMQETMQALLRWTETSTRQNVTRSHVEDFAAAYAWMNSEARLFGKYGLAGANGEALLSQMNQALMQGGAAGDASQFVTARALSRSGVIDPYKQQYLLEAGMFGRGQTELGEGSNRTNYELVKDEVDSIYRNAPEHVKLNAMARYWGINMHQAKAMAGFNGGTMNALSDVLGRYNLSIKDVDPSALNDIFALQGSTDLDGWRDRVKGRKGVTAADRATLDSLSGEDLRAELVRVLARVGADKTPGVQIQESIAGFNNALTKIGEPLVALTTEIRDGIGFIGGKIGDIAHFFAGAVREGGVTAPLPGPRKSNLTLPGGAGGAVVVGGGAPAAGPIAGGGTGVADFVNALGGVESSNGLNTVSKTSSARGNFQFIKSTWLKVARKHGGDRVAGLSDDALLALRDDPAFSAEMARAHVENDIDPTLRRAGVPVTAVNRYAGWHFGESVGAMLAKAPDDSMVADIVGDVAVAANPYLRGMTVGQWKARFGKKFGGATATSGTPLPPNDPRKSHQQVSGLFGFDGPLRIVVAGADGTIREELQMPVTAIGPARPWGLA